MNQQGKPSAEANRIKAERERRGWSQQDLADQIDGGCDARTIGRWEKGQVKPNPHNVQELSRVFGKTPEELGLRKVTPPTEPIVDVKNRMVPPVPVVIGAAETTAPLWNVPHVFSRCLGRSREIEEICLLLRRDDVYWLTLKGTGGIGKTRLSIEVATRLRGFFSDGVCFVAFTSSTRPELVLSMIAAALNIQEAFDKPLLPLLQSALQEKHLLLILDSFEGQTSIASAIEKILETCPKVKILATSTASLHLSAVSEYPVEPLSVPPEGMEISPEACQEYSSVALFLERVRRLIPGFRLTDANTSEIIQICRHLDGLPLALELAASLMNILTPQNVLKRIVQERFHLLEHTHLANDHQRRLFETIEASYLLLTPAEQWLYLQLSAFVGGCSLEAVESLCAQYIQPLDAMTMLASLVDKSLIQHSTEKDLYTMFESLREFGRARALKLEEWEASRQRHARYYMAFAEQAGPHLRGKEQKQWLDRMELEKENLRTTLIWMLEQGQSEQLFLFCDTYGKFCGLRGYWREQQQCLEKALGLSTDLSPSKSLGNLLRRAGHLAYRFRELEKARALLERGERISRQVKDYSTLAGVLNTLGWVYYRQKDLLRAQQTLQESLDFARQSGDRWSLSNALNSLGRFLCDQGQNEQGLPFLQEAVELARQIGDQENLARLLGDLAEACFGLGDFKLAEECALESYDLALKCDNNPLLALAEESLAEIALFEERYTDARELYNQRGKRAEELGDQPTLARVGLRLGDLAYHDHDFDYGMALVQESLKVFEEQKDNPYIARAYCLQADLLRQNNQFANSRPFYYQALKLECDLHNARNIARSACGLAEAFLEERHFEEAARLLAFCQPYIEGPEGQVHPALARDYQQACDSALDSLGRARYDLVWTRGQQLTLQEVSEGFH